MMVRVPCPIFAGTRRAVAHTRPSAASREAMPEHASADCELAARKLETLPQGGCVVQNQNQNQPSQLALAFSLS